MTVLAAIRDWFGWGRPPGTDFYDLAERESRVPEAELAIAEAALSGGGPLAERALRQLHETHTAYRLRSDGGTYELRITTFENLIIRGAPRAGWTSDSIVLETADGRSLQLEIEVGESGIIGFAGRSGDGGRWPKAWQVTPGQLDQIRAQGPWLRLPTPDELKADRARAASVIGAWLGEPDLLRGRRGAIHAEPPASDDALPRPGPSDLGGGAAATWHEARSTRLGGRQPGSSHWRGEIVIAGRLWPMSSRSAAGSTRADGYDAFRTLLGRSRPFDRP